MLYLPIDHPKFTTNYTKVWCEDAEDMKFNAPHHFKVTDSSGLNEISKIDFQEGPIKEHGVNGVCNEDLILMVVCRLEGFQKSEYACKENAEALEHLYAAVDALRSRTNRRVAAGVEGTSALDPKE